MKFTYTKESERLQLILRFIDEVKDQSLPKSVLGHVQTVSPEKPIEQTSKSKFVSSSVEQKNLFSDLDSESFFGKQTGELPPDFDNTKYKDRDPDWWKQ